MMGWTRPRRRSTCRSSGAVRRENRTLGIEFQDVVFGGQRRVVISGNHGTGRAGRGSGGWVVRIAAVVARMLASVRLPVVALVVFKVRNIVGELRPCVGLVLASTVGGSLLACGHGRRPAR